MKWLESFTSSIGATQHKTSPIVWFGGEEKKYLGGRDDTLAWCRTVVQTIESKEKEKENHSRYLNNQLFNLLKDFKSF
jgi:hypothetical protein